LQHLPRIHEADVADVFAAFDIDRDNIISQKDMASIMKQDNEATTSKFVRCEMM
jgi:Ca2+-binding EF-hand superfamily protein